MLPWDTHPPVKEKILEARVATRHPRHEGEKTEEEHGHRPHRLIAARAYRPVIGCSREGERVRFCPGLMWCVDWF